MERPTPTFESPTTRTWVLRSGADTAGELHEQRVEYAPGSPFPSAHYHPSQDEHFDVEQGAMVYVVEGREQTVRAGESIDLPAGTAHKARNASGSEPAMVRWETRPALRTGEFFAIAAELGDAGALDRALLAQAYRDVFRVTGLLRVVVPPLATVARLLGRRLPQAGRP